MGGPHTLDYGRQMVGPRDDMVWGQNPQHDSPKRAFAHVKLMSTNGAHMGRPPFELLYHYLDKWHEALVVDYIDYPIYWGVANSACGNIIVGDTKSPLLYEINVTKRSWTLGAQNMINEHIFMNIISLEKNFNTRLFWHLKRIMHVFKN